MRVALVACSAGKAAAPCSAREMYTGALFRLSRAWVEQRIESGTLQGWGILSAKHGLVDPWQVIEPYDTAFRDVDGEEWFARVHQALVDRWGTATIYTLLAGGDYRMAVRGMPYV